MEQLEQRLLLDADSWQNPARDYDVNNDGNGSALDALMVINHLNRTDEVEYGPRNNRLAPYYDVNGDGRASASDALRVVNHLYQPGRLAAPSQERLEGESESAPAGFVSVIFGMLPGDSTEQVELQTSMTIGGEEFNELGFFVTETLEGHVDGFAPDTPGYADAVFANSQRQVAYSHRDVFQTERSITFQAGQMLGVYVLQRATDVGDSAAHLRVRENVSAESMRIGWEEHAADSWLYSVGDRGYDDVTVDVRIGQPFSGNAPPVISAIADRTIDEQTSLVIDVPAIDPDGDSLNYSLDESPTGMSVDSSGMIAWTPSEQDGPGVFPVIVRATDQEGVFDTRPFTVTVREVNSPPVLAPIDDQFAIADAELTLTAAATDPDIPANQLTYSLIDPPAGAHIEPNSGQFRWTPTAEQLASPADITVEVSDNGVPASTDRTTFTVSGDGCPPGSDFSKWTHVGQAPPDTSFQDDRHAEPALLGSGSVDTSGCQAVLVEGDSLLVTLATSFVVPAGATTLSFTYEDLNFDTTDTDFINDAFEAALVDQNGNSLVATYTSDRDAFFNISEDVGTATGSGVSIEGTTVTVDLSEVLEGESATLFLRLANNDDDTTTSVRITAFDLPGEIFAPSGLLRDSSTNQLIGESSTSAPPSLSRIRIADIGGATSTSQNSEVVSDSTADGRIIAIGDEWLLSDPAFEQQPEQTSVLIQNLTTFLADGRTGNFLAASDTQPTSLGVRGVTGDRLADAVEALGHSWTLDTNPELTQENLSQYDAVFLVGVVGSGESNADVWTQYVRNGGSVVVMAATGDFGSVDAEAAAWNPFLNEFGLAFGDTWFFNRDNLHPPVPIVAGAHPLTVELDEMLWSFGQLVVDTDPNDPLNEIAVVGDFSAEPGPFSGNQNIIAVYNVPRSLGAPVISVNSPVREIAAGDNVILSGQATVNANFNTRSPNTIDVVTRNGKPVDVLDVAGRFYTSVEILPGENTFTFVATDSVGQTAEATITIVGTQPTSEFDLSRFTDITGSFSGVYGRTSFNDETSQLHVDLATRNDGTFESDVPLLVGVRNISDPTVRALDPDGFMPDGTPYYDFTDQIDGGRLAPGETSDTPTISFSAPLRQQFNYDLVFFGKLNQAPIITTVPQIEAAYDREYIYDVDATDADEDALTYALTTSPAGMTIESSSGEIAWTPTIDDFGLHDVAIEVTDGRGGTAQQRYTISVIEAPPNRPPVITSTPVTVATVSSRAFPEITYEGEWRYQVVSIGDQPGFEHPDFDDSSFLVGRGGFGSATSCPLNQTARATDWPLRTDILLRQTIRLPSNVGSVVVEGAIDNDIRVFVNGQDISAGVQTNEGCASLNEFSIPVPDSVLKEGDNLVAIRATDRGSQSYVDARVSVEAASELVAIAGENYTYNVIGFDPDSDALSYRLPQSPAGMRINSVSGLIEWGPTARQIGNHNVTVEVTDGNGGVAIQEYIVCVHPDPQNHPPVIVSEPVTELVDGASSYQYDVDAIDPDDDELTYSLVDGPAGMTIASDSGIVQWTPSHNALEFDGDDFVWVSDDPSLRPEDVTIEGWFSFDATDGLQLLVDKHLGDGDLDSYEMWYQNGTLRGVVMDFDGTGPQLSTPFTPNIGQWYHLAYTFDDAADSQSLYINGELQTTGNVTKSIEYDSDPLLLGASYDGNSPQHFFEGRMDEVRVWGVARSQAEISGNMNRRAGDDSDLVAYWNFDEGEGNVAADRSHHRNEGVLGEDGIGDDLPGWVTSTAPVGFEGAYPVGVRVDDGRGGFDEQRFEIILQQPGSGEIRGTKREDSSVETGLEGWTIYLDQNQNGILDVGEESTVTNTDGEYAFTGLPEGTYYVREVPQQGWVQVSPGLDDDAEFFGPAHYLGRADSPFSATEFDRFFLEDFEDGELDIPGVTFDFARDFGVSSGLQIVVGGGATDNVDDDDGTIDGDGSFGGVLAPIGNPSGGASQGVEFAFDRDVLGAHPTHVGIVWTDGSPNETVIFEAVDSAGDVVVSTRNEGIGDGSFFGTTDEDRFFGAAFAGGIASFRIYGEELGRNSFEVDHLQVGIGGFGDFHRVALDDGEVASDVDFVNRQISDPTNRSPSIASSPILSASPVNTYFYDAGATDPDNDPLAFSLPVAPEGMTVHPTLGTVVWTPGHDQVGQHNVLLRVTDERGGSAVQSFAVTVQKQNVPPVITSPHVGHAPHATNHDDAGMRSMPYAGGVFTDRVTAQDADGDPVTFRLDEAPDVMMIETVERTNPAGDLVEMYSQLVWDVPESAAGTDVSVTIVASDGTDEVSHSFTLNILDALTTNVAPTIDSTPPSSARFGVQWIYAAGATDANGDPLTWSLAEAPVGMQVSPEGLVTWTPPVDSPESVPVELVVDDGREGQTSQAFDLRVSPISQNAAPTITSVPPVQAVLDQPYVYDAVANDPDGDFITFRLDAAPRGMSIDSVTGSIRWTPDDQQLGTHIVAVTAADPLLGESTQRFELHVGCNNIAPAIVSVPPTVALTERSLSVPGTGR